MGYGRFVEQKKALEGAGCTYTTKKRFCYLSEVLRDDDLEAKLDQAGLAPYEYSTHPEASEEPPGMHETEENEESGEEERNDRASSRFRVTQRLQSPGNRQPLPAMGQVPRESDRGRCHSPSHL